MRIYIQYPIVLLFIFWHSLTYSQTETTPPTSQSNASATTNTAVTTPPATSAVKSSTDASSAYVAPKLKPPPSHFKITETTQSTKELQEKSKERYNVWFSPNTKLAIDYPYKKSFMSWPRIYDIDRAQMPTCKKKFNTLCGAEDYPLAEKFIFCLQDKFDQYKSNPSCATMGHYLVHINFYRYLAYNTEPCKTILDKCAKNPPNPGMLPWQCALADKKTPPLCNKLINDFLRMRVFAARMYDEKLVCPPGGCN